ncbi:hypothetical protein ACFO5Q_04425 [Kordiimonas lipolytica]|uniref:Uncharacterized protein n=1 Tax=Kordiimonas lipolytica TaxID=1662421 RepID=A0ABV8U8J0_9PROT|nr:hypothetical protein [Kordiimonas lipolytica]
MQSKHYLTKGHQRFAKLLSSCPELFEFWDFSEGSMKADELSDAIGYMSRGEQIMAKFFAAVWWGKNSWNFDLIEAAGSLDRSNREIVSKWLADPFWP